MSLFDAQECDPGQTGPASFTHAKTERFRRCASYKRKYPGQFEGADYENEVKVKLDRPKNRVRVRVRVFSIFFYSNALLHA